MGSLWLNLNDIMQDNPTREVIASELSPEIDFYMNIHSMDQLFKPYLCNIRRPAIATQLHRLKQYCLKYLNRIMVLSALLEV